MKKIDISPIVAYRSPSCFLVELESGHLMQDASPNGGVNAGEDIKDDGEFVW